MGAGGSNGRRGKMKEWRERRRRGKEGRREGGRRGGTGEERRGDVRYLGWVSTPYNLSGLTRTTSCDAGRSST